MISKSLSSNNYLLVDNITRLEDLADYTSKQIITFDYDSHIFLIKQKIPHIISDKFHSVLELESIEELIHSFVKWYDIPSIKNLISDNGINLGELFYLEFRDILVSFLKKFIEIFNLVKLYPSAHFFASENISEIISKFTQNISNINIKNQNISIYDSIDVPLKFGSKQFTLKISTKNFSKIQTILNKTCDKFFLHKKTNQTYSDILLVNFSTIKNKELLLEIQNFNLNIISYNRTTPSIWNISSFNIIKNSNCIIENKYALLSKKSKDKIKQNEKLFLSKLNSILSSKDLQKHFSLEQITFWDALKPLFIRLCEKRFLQAAKEIELAKNLLNKYNFSKILLFNESGMVEQIILKLAKYQKIPIFLVQHGLYYNSKEMTDESIFQRSIPKNCDYFIGWGDTMKDYLLHTKFDSNKIKILGSTFFDKLFQNKIHPCTDSGYVLLACDPLAFNRLMDLSIDQKELYRNTIEKICKYVSKHNKKLIIKTHPQKNQYEKQIAHSIDPTIQVFYSGDVQPLINSSDLVITTDVTTVILESMIMQKPVISIRLKEHYGIPDIFNFCPQISIDSLDSWLKLFYTNSKLKNTLISKGNEYTNSYLSNHGNACKSILKFLQEF